MRQTAQITKGALLAAPKKALLNYEAFGIVSPESNLKENEKVRELIKTTIVELTSKLETPENRTNFAKLFLKKLNKISLEAITITL